MKPNSKCLNKTYFFLCILYRIGLRTARLYATTDCKIGFKHRPINTIESNKSKYIDKPPH